MVKYQSVVNQVQLARHRFDVRYRLSFEYALMNDVMRIIKDFDLKPENQHFDLDCTLELSIRQSLSVRLYDAVANLRAVKIEVI